MFDKEVTLMSKMRFGWVENAGDLEVQRSITRAELKRVIMQQIITHVQCIYRHEQMACALYRTLAEKTRDPDRRDLLQQLAGMEQRRMQRCAVLLRRLNAPLPAESHSVIRRVWIHLLSVAGIRWALAWIEWKKCGDARRHLALLQTLRSLKR
jgi:hypothetical protein